MTTRTLESGGDWSTSGNWSGATKPIDADDALIPGRLNADVTESGDEAAIDCNVIDIHKDFGRLFGTGGSPIHIGCDELRVQGSLGAYFNLDDDGAVDNQVLRTWIMTRSPTTPVWLGKDAGARAGSNYLEIYVQRATVTLLSSIAYAAGGIVHLGHVDSIRGDATLIAASGGPTLPELQVNGGRAFINSACMLAHIANGGVMVQDKAAVTTAYVNAGGILRIDYGGAGVTVATKVHVKAGGTLDLLGTQDEKTITTVIAEKGATVLKAPAPLHTFTTFHDRRSEAA